MSNCGEVHPDVTWVVFGQSRPLVVFVAQHDCEVVGLHQLEFSEHCGQRGVHGRPRVGVSEDRSSTVMPGGGGDIDSRDGKAGSGRTFTLLMRPHRLCPRQRIGTAGEIRRSGAAESVYGDP